MIVLFNHESVLSMMNRLLNFAVVPLLIACVIRWNLASMSGVSALDVRTFSGVEIWAYPVCLVLAFLWFWHVFLRRACPDCKSYAIHQTGTEELNQYHTIRKIQERDNNGRSVTRNLNVTVAEIRSHFRCRDCSHEWHIDFKRDKR